MKILHVNAGNEYGGGLSHIIALLKAIKNAEVHLLVFENGPVYKAALENDIPVFLLEQTSRYDLGVRKKLYNFIVKGNYDIVHTHGPRANTFLAALKKSLSAKWVITLHSNPYLDFKGRGILGKAFEWIHVRTLKRADHIIAVSNEIKKAAVDLGGTDEQAIVIHNGISSAESSGPVFEKQELFTMITIGRLEWVKGHEVLFDALYQANIKDWKLFLCGSGSQEEALKKQAEKLNISDSVNFLGWLNKKEIEEKLHHSDLMVLPSLSESFPLAALEAGQLGIPTIATDVGDVKEIIANTHLGWLVKSGEKKSLVKALEEAYELWKKAELTEIGRDFYEWTKRFTEEEQAEKTVNVYRKLLKNQ